MSLAAWQRDKEKGPEAEIRGAERGRRAVAAHGRAPSLPLRVCAGRAAGRSGPRSPDLGRAAFRRRRPRPRAVTHAARAGRPREAAAARVGSGAPRRRLRPGPAPRRQARSVDLRAEDAAGLEDGSGLGAALLPPGAFLGAGARDRPRRALVLLRLRLRALPG